MTTWVWQEEWCFMWLPYQGRALAVHCAENTSFMCGSLEPNMVPGHTVGALQGFSKRTLPQALRLSSWWDPSEKHWDFCSVCSMGWLAENFSSLDSQGAILLRISSHHHFPFSGFEKGSYFLSSFYINGRRNVETQTHIFS